MKLEAQQWSVDHPLQNASKASGYSQFKWHNKELKGITKSM
jgi:hypothetical protein